MPRYGDAPLMHMERAATSMYTHTHTPEGPQQRSEALKYRPCALQTSLLYVVHAGLFGVKRYGVHVNGFSRDDAGRLSMWVARRSDTKPTYPGKLDNLVTPAHQ